MSNTTRPNILHPYAYGEDASESYPNVSLSIETITPDVASKMLKANVANRGKKKESIASQIRNGEWVLNGESIIFADDGTLLDGQNRLYACIASGKPIVSVIVRGVKRLSQTSIDTGIKRNLGDYLKMLGYKNHTVVASMGQGLYRADRRGIESAFVQENAEARPSIQKTLMYIEENYADRIEPLISPARKVSYNYRRGVQKGTLGVLFDAFRKSGDENMTEFVRQMCLDEPDYKGITLLKNRLTKNANSNTGMLSQQYIAALIIKAWNSFITGADIQQLSYSPGGLRPEKFPSVFYVNE